MTNYNFVEPTFEASLIKLSNIVDKREDIENMKAFVLCHAPTVYNTLLNSISNERQGAKRMVMQEKRVTSLIWHLLYFR